MLVVFLLSLVLIVALMYYMVNIYIYILRTIQHKRFQ